MPANTKNSGRVLTCVYCGHEYPQNTPAHGSSTLTEHIKTCPKHPLRKAEYDISKLRSALVGLVGVDGANDLGLMLSSIELTGAPPEEIKTLRIAITALVDTLPARHA